MPLYLNSEIKSGDRIKVDDKIEARVTPDGHLITMAAQISQSGIAPPFPNMDPTAPQRFPEGNVAQ